MVPMHPDERLFIAKSRARELHSEAESNRLDCRPRWNGLPIAGLNIHLGSVLIVVGRTLQDKDACRPFPARSFPAR